MPGNPQKSTAAFAASFLLPALLGPLVVRWRHDASLAAPVLHAVVVGAALAVALTPLLLRRDPPGTATRAAFGFVSGTLLTFLLLFHGLTILGWSAWHAPLSARLTTAYAAHVPTLLAVVGVPPWVAFGLLLAVWAAACAWHASLASPVLQTLHHLVARVGPRRAWARAAVVVGVVLLVYAATRPLWVVREPLHIAFHDDWSQAKVAPVSLFVEYSAGRGEQLAPADVAATALRPRTLVLIVVDALRRDQMGVYGGPLDNTPFLSRLHREGRLARIGPAYSVCTVSFCGVLGTLASRSWEGLDRPPVTLPDVLSRYGYSSRYFLAGDHSRFGLLRELTERSVDRYVDATQWPDRYANDDRDAIAALAREPLASAPPLFLYVHLMSVHALGVRQPAFRRWQPDTLSLWERWRDPEGQQAAYARRYHNGILQADDLIRQVFDVLREASRLDDALVIVTADHGESLGEDGRFAHGGEPDEALTGVPLLVYDGQANYAPRAIASQIDIAPTFLRAIGAPVPASFMGIPLQEPTTRTTVPVASGDMTGVVRATAAGPVFEVRAR